MRMTCFHERARGLGQPPTGRSISIKGASIIQLEGDKIVSDQCYFVCRASSPGAEAIPTGLRAHKQGNKAVQREVIQVTRSRRAWDLKETPSLELLTAIHE